MEEPLIELRCVSKNFGGVRALDNVSFAVRRGEVHALVGENGAGKSTLLKLLAGVHQPDSGQILLDGRGVPFSNPRDAYHAGVSIVFQELNLFPHRSIAANLFANHEWTRGGLGWVDRRGMIQATNRVLKQLNLSLSPETRVGQLRAAEKQLVEIARALHQQARILILDEPNSSLGSVESERLFEILRRLRQNNVTILYVSHRLEEVFAIADRVTVLRDGQCQGTLSILQTSIPEVVQMMVGRPTGTSFPKRRPFIPGPIILEARDLRCRPRLGPLSFSVRAGEIVGFVGLEGAGVDQVFELLLGLRRLTGGKVLFRGSPLAHAKPWYRIRQGWALLPPSRREQGLMMAWSTARNATLLILDQLRGWWGLIDLRAMRRRTNAVIQELNIQGAGPATPVWQLSGGNQQKVLLAKWLAIQPAILMLEDPTRGIDVGAKSEIYQLCHKLADQGIAILLASSETEEVTGLADHVLVLSKGKLVRQFRRGEATQSQIMHALTSGTDC